MSTHPMTPEFPRFFWCSNEHKLRRYSSKDGLGKFMDSGNVTRIPLETAELLANDGYYKEITPAEAEKILKGEPN